MVSWSLYKPSSMMAVMARMSVSAVLLRVFMSAPSAHTDRRRLFRLPDSFACLGLGRVFMPWVTVGGRGGSVQFGLGA